MKPFNLLSWLSQLIFSSLYSNTISVKVFVCMFHYYALFPFSGILLDRGKRKICTFKKKWKENNGGQDMPCQTRDKVEGGERNVSLDAKRRNYLKGLVGTYQGKQGWSVQEG